jgi:ABC-2 type transport system permease protein
MIDHQLALIKREIREHRSIWLTPAVIAVVIALLTVTGQVSISAFNKEIDLAILGASNVDDVHRKIALMALFGVVTTIFSIGAAIMVIFYSLDTLYAERKDKSILFWRSLPITDAETVVSKLITAAVVIPLAFLAGAIVTELVVMVLSSIWIMTQGGDAGHLLWSSAPLLDFWLGSLFMAIAMPLWLSPFIGWFLFVSAYTKRSPLLLAFLPIIVVPMLERLLIGSHLFYDAILVRTTRPPIADVEGWEVFENYENMQLSEESVSLLGSIDISGFMTSPSLWGGLVVCGLFTTAAIYMRRYRDESY